MASRQAQTRSGSNWEKRNAKARSLGYRNYYDYRIHGSGKLPPSEKVSGEPLARARGHRSQADLLRSIGEGDTVAVWRTGPRDSEGRYQWVDMLLVDARGKETLFRLRGKQISAKNLDQLTGRIQSSGAIVSPAPSLDIRTLIEDVNEMDEEDSEE